MIRTVADFLHELKAKETERLREFGDVKHGPMIGGMYEGLTKHLVGRAVFRHLDLRVVSGKVQADDGRLSDQIDCMVVEGEGRQLPFTDDWIYPVGQVVAVVEVKKNLYSGDLQSAHENLTSVADAKGKPALTVTRGARKAFQSVARRDLPADLDLDAMPFSEGMLALSIIKDAALPLRVVFGYDGFASEHSLRESFLRYLEKRSEGASPGRLPQLVPHGLPDLIVCGEATLVKLNGMPYAGQILAGKVENPHHGGDGWYPIYGSLPSQPLLVLLELLWCRLRQRFAVPRRVFGEDLELEPVEVLLFAKGVRHGGMGGWTYTFRPLSAEDLPRERRSKGWEPVVLSEDQLVVFTFLLRDGFVRLDGRGFITWAARNDIDLSRFLEELVATGLVYVEDNRTLRPLTEQCTVARTSDGRIVAAENEDGRLTRWLKGIDPGKEIINLTGAEVPE